MGAAWQINVYCSKYSEFILCLRNGYILRHLNVDFIIKDCLFWTVKLTKNVDPDKCSYGGYGIGFDSHSLFSLPNFDWDKTSTIIEVGNSSSLHIDNKKKLFLSSF